MSLPKYNEDKMKKEEEYWCVEGSDDEKYDPSKSGKGVWEPSAEDILKLFDKLKNDKVIKLKWECPGRRPPGSDKEEESKDEEMDVKEEDTSTDKEEKKPEQPTEFDFDDDEFNDSTNPITPRRTPGSKTPKSQKKVATMDKVLKNIMIERKQAALQKEARKLAKSPRTPQGASRPKISTPPVTSNTGQGQKLTPLRPPTSTDAPPIRNLALSSAPESQSSAASTDVKAPGTSDQSEKTGSKTDDKGS